MIDRIGPFTYQILMFANEQATLNKKCNLDILSDNLAYITSVTYVIYS